ncbi:OmpA family protein [Pseudonocardia sp. TRM90224]|uniref:OmpA family protein n=1 Tax=Pseudonocardia sp. TRM90224 TaxID=2812678 RepID=UPI001E3B1966|nr:OmpA family protein [Pseudonocardia sp. TRM90224]
MMRWRMLGVLLLLVPACACAAAPPVGAPSRPTAPIEHVPTPPAAPGVAAAASTGLQLEGHNFRLVRLNADEMALQFDVVNNGTEDFIHVSDWTNGFNPPLRLVDLPRGAEYTVLQTDVPGGLNPRTSAIDKIRPGVPVTVTTVYRAPPPETTQMLVTVQLLQPVLVGVEPVGAPLKDDPVLHEPRADDGRSVVPVVCDVGGGSSDGGTVPAQLRLSSDLLFAFGSAELTPRAATAISELDEQIDAKSGTVRIEGHTDAIGDEAANLRLSEQRAAAVREALAARLGPGFTFESVGLGETQPIAANQRADGSDDPDGRAQNRRVVIRVGAAGTTAKPVGARRLSSNWRDPGLTAEVGSARRIGPYVLVTVLVRNTTSSTVQTVIAPPSFQVIGPEPTGVTLVDRVGQRRHRMCFATGWLGNKGLAYTHDSVSEIPPGVEVAFHGLYQAPGADVDSVDVEIDGFDAVVPTQLTPM